VNFKDRSIVAAVAVAAATRRPTPSSAWITHLIGLSALVGLLAVLNAQAIAATVQLWWRSPTFSDCFLVILVSAYFVWCRRHVLAALTAAAYPRALRLFRPLVLVSLVGELMHINEVEQLAFVGLLQVLILAFLGLQIYRRILLPSLFLFFLVPMGEYLIAPLQHFTTHCISAGLTLLGIAHYTEVNVIQLSNGNYQVAEACAGLRFLIAAIAVGVLFVYLTYRKWYKIVLYLAASVVVPVTANGYRALGIVRASRPLERQPHRPWRRSHHLWLGYADPISTEESGAPALLYWQSHRPSHLSTAAFSAPLTPERWQTGAVSDGWSPNYAAPDARLAFAVHKAGSFALDVDVFVNYYAGGNGCHNLVSSAKKLSVQGVWRPLSQGTAEAVLGGRMVHLGEAVISSAGLTRMIWWTYWSGGRFTASGLDVKLDRLRHALSGGGSALVAVSTPVDVENGEVRARLRRALGALGGIAARLEEARRS
jgi:EpsI family protein